MLRDLNAIYNYNTIGIDGKFGHVYDFFFDDQTFNIRYLIVDTKKILFSKKVLIAPESFSGEPDWAGKIFPLSLTKKQIENSPDIDTNKPVSLKKEAEITKYYNWPIYWDKFTYTAENGKALNFKMHLRSCKKVEGYRIHATDGKIGHLQDFIVEDKNWNIRYFIITTTNWVHGKNVLISPEWIEKISWEENEIYIKLTGKQIKHSPEYNPDMPVNRKYEEVLYDFYGKPKYWK